MRRHAGMEFAAGTVVFPGGGVDDRDRNADIAWAGPPPSVVGAAVRHRNRPGRGAGVRRRARDLRGMRRVVRRPGRRPERHRQRRVGLPRIPAGAGRPDAVVRRLPAPGKPGAAGRSAAAVGQLGDTRSRAHPPLRHLLLRRSAAARVSEPTGTTPNPTVRSGPRRRPPSPNSKPGVAFCCRRPGHSWTR